MCLERALAPAYFSVICRWQAEILSPSKDQLYTTCTPGSHSKLQQSRHLASSIIAMPSVMFKDIGKACSGALAHASEAVRLKAKSCSVVARVRAFFAQICSARITRLASRRSS